MVQGRSVSVSFLYACSNLPLVLPVEARRQQGVLGRVVAEEVEQGVGHVGLEAERLRAADQLQQLHHAAPAVHAAPADLALGRQPLAVLLGDVAGLAEGLGDPLLVAFRILGPGARIDRRSRCARRRRAARPSARELPGDARRPCGPAVRNFLRSSSPPMAEPPPAGAPDRRHQRPDHQVLGADLVGQALQVVVGGVDVHVRRAEEEVDAVEPLAVHLGRGGQLDHLVEADDRLGAGGTLAHHPGPGRVVELRIVVLRARHGSSSSSPGPRRAGRMSLGTTSERCDAFPLPVLLRPGPASRTGWRSPGPDPGAPPGA